MALRSALTSSSVHVLRQCWAQRFSDLMARCVDGRVARSNSPARLPCTLTNRGYMPTRSTKTLTSPFAREVSGIYAPTSFTSSPLSALALTLAMPWMVMRPLCTSFTSVELFFSQSYTMIPILSLHTTQLSFLSIP